MKKLGLFLLNLSIMYISETYALAPSDYILYFDDTRTYQLSDGGRYVFHIENYQKNGITYNLYSYRYDADGQLIKSNREDWDYALNGERVSTGAWRLKFNFDENGNFLGETGYHEGGITSTAISTDSGKILTYDLQGKLQGAYTDLLDYMAQKYISKNVLKLDLTDEDGNYYERDSHGNITDIYHQDGTVEKGKYSYVYDGAGNITAIYKDGISTYKRTSYTPAEAAAATNRGNNNTITFTFK